MDRKAVTYILLSYIIFLAFALVMSQYISRELGEFVFNSSGIEYFILAIVVFLLYLFISTIKFINKNFIKSDNSINKKIFTSSLLSAIAILVFQIALLHMWDILKQEICFFQHFPYIDILTPIIGYTIIGITIGIIFNKICNGKLVNQTTAKLVSLCSAFIAGFYYLPFMVIGFYTANKPKKPKKDKVKNKKLVKA